MGDKFQSRTTGSVMFTSMRTNVVSVLCSKDLLLDLQELTLTRREGAGTGRQSLIKYVRQIWPNFKKIQG